MARLKIDPEMMALAGKIERIAKVKIKDCYKDDLIYIVVEKGHLWKALGKKGANVKKIQKTINHKVKIIEFNPDLKKFVKNIICPLEVEQINQDKNIIFIKDKSKKTKSLLIGRAGKNLKLINRAVKRFFDIEEVKVV